MALAVGDLVDADPREAVQAIALPSGGVLGHHPLDHPANRVPVDPHQGGDRRLGRVLDQVHRGVLEGAAEARSRPRPRHRLDPDTAPGALHPPDLAADHAPDPSKVEMAPTHRAGVVGDANPLG